MRRRRRTVLWWRSGCLISRGAPQHGQPTIVVLDDGIAGYRHCDGAMSYEEDLSRIDENYMPPEEDLRHSLPPIYENYASRLSGTPGKSDFRGGDHAFLKPPRLSSSMKAFRQLAEERRALKSDPNIEETLVEDTTTFDSPKEVDLHITDFVKRESKECAASVRTGTNDENDLYVSFSYFP
ncbi:unnamed protein product [Gongylonema pulchrum]|uniref:Uncharacterized protein n=1 Tax=Gongylonema pulchrum TaxID=637853 RepID=A0A183DRW2_9BILA|nr:unnamed protein product [Gongylonema pulchrum]